MIIKRPPTHTMVIRVPLAASDAEAAEVKVASQEALRVILEVIRVGTLGLLCDEIQVGVARHDPTDD